ncbi:phage GP46 family protein [Serratia symbiotica]|uniref:phage GP46 family protein n=1 Tax=Serratia symbiotica TaxID=138074 RepID=UPI003EB9C7FD
MKVWTAVLACVTTIVSNSQPVYLRLKTPLASYWADPWLGSRLHELERAKGSATTHRLAQQYSRTGIAAPAG